MDVNFPAIIMAIAGTFFFIRNITHMRDEEKLRHYVQTSPKAQLWVKKYGEEKTIEICRRTFLPLGTLVAALMVIFAISMLI
jgi:hypothetical protein